LLRFGGISQAKGGFILVDFTLFLLQSSPNNSAVVKEKLDNTFVQYKNLSVDSGIFGVIFSGYEKHEYVFSAAL
jgi:hypothetical protein